MTEELNEKKPRKRPKKVVPVGNQFLSGLPKKEMTWAEWLELPKDKREHALKLGIYEVTNGS